MWWIIGIFVYILGARVFYLADEEDLSILFWPLVMLLYIIFLVIDIPARWLVKKLFK